VEVWEWQNGQKIAQIDSGLQSSGRTNVYRTRAILIPTATANNIDVMWMMTPQILHFKWRFGTIAWFRQA
jgi:hypothetical protein